MDLSQFHEDHAFLRCQAVRLHDLITRDEPAVDRAARLHAALHVLRARLALHLAIEDRFLYPQVEAAEPDELLGTAYDLRRALGHLDQSLSALMERFDHAAAIEKQPEIFERLLGDLLSSLQQRMDQEEAQLFPIAAVL